MRDPWFLRQVWIWISMFACEFLGVFVTHTHPHSLGFLLECISVFQTRFGQAIFLSSPHILCNLAMATQSMFVGLSWSWEWWTWCYGLTCCNTQLLGYKTSAVGSKYPSMSVYSRLVRFPWIIHRRVTPPDNMAPQAKHFAMSWSCL